MSEAKQTPAEIKAELDASILILQSVRDRIAVVNKTITDLEAELKELTEKEVHFAGGWRSIGMISILQASLESALQLEANKSLPIVSVKPRWSSDEHQWRFMKKTPKRIFLIREDSTRPEQWDLSGKHSYEGPIVEGDLARILDGSINAKERQ